MELTPRTGPGAASVRRRRRRPLPMAVLGLVLAGLGVVSWQGLTEAAVYFHDADTAVAKREEYRDDRRFRLHGAVVPGTIVPTGAGTDFRVAYGGVEVDVRHAGATPELFQEGIPVVLEGNWSAAGDWFESDRLLIKHSEVYEPHEGPGPWRPPDLPEGHPERTVGAGYGGQASYGYGGQASYGYGGQASYGYGGQASAGAGGPASAGAGEAPAGAAP